MIIVCPSCSGIEIEKLESKYGAENIEVSCIGECGGLDNLVIGYCNGKFIETNTEEEFIKKIDEEFN